MRTRWLIPMSLLCALLLGAVLYLRLNGGEPTTRIAILLASVTMAVVMVRLVGRDGGAE